MTKKVKKWVLLFGSTLLSLVVGYLIFRPGSENQQTLKRNKTAPTPTIINAPDLIIIEHTPKEIPIYAFWSTNPVDIIFNQLVDPEEVTISVVPEVDLIIATKKPSETIRIVPATGWADQVTYKITIETSTASLRGKYLKEKYEFSIRREIPKEGTPEYDPPDHGEHSPD